MRPMRSVHGVGAHRRSHVSDSAGAAVQVHAPSASLSTATYSLHYGAAKGLQFLPHMDSERVDPRL